MLKKSCGRETHFVYHLFIGRTAKKLLKKNLLLKARPNMRTYTPSITRVVDEDQQPLQPVRGRRKKRKVAAASEEGSTTQFDFPRSELPGLHVLARGAEEFEADRIEGMETDRKEGFVAGRKEAGREEDFEAVRKEGMEAGRKEGMEAGRKEGMEAGRKEGIEAGRKEGFKAGRKEGFKAGVQVDIGR